jgi:hypothetical protein
MLLGKAAIGRKLPAKGGANRRTLLLRVLKR